MTTQDSTTWLPPSACRHGALYRLSSRNLALGVYHSANQGFIGIRCKFGTYYLATEYHWDVGPPHGTARPLQFLEDCPLEPIEGESDEVRNVWVQNGPLLAWLAERKKQYLGREITLSAAEDLEDTDQDIPN